MKTVDFWSKYKFALDGSHFNYNHKYNEPIEVHKMDIEDIKTFKRVLLEISTELNMVIDPYFDEEWQYWLAGMYIEESANVSYLMAVKGLTYE